MKLIEILDAITDVCVGHPNINGVTVCTMEDLLVKVSEKKNEYVGAFIVYDLGQIQIGEYSITLPISIILADKLRVNDANKLFIHSNTLSISIDLLQLLRLKANELNLGGLDSVPAEMWTEQYSDGLIAGSKFDFNIQANLGGFCDIINN